MNQARFEISAPGAPNSAQQLGGAAHGLILPTAVVDGL